MVSWRSKKSIALMESKDDIVWTRLVVVLGPNGKTDWQEDINGSVVIKHGDVYRMWYIRQARGKL